MIETLRITTGRENAVIDSLTYKIKSSGADVKSIIRFEEIKGYIFIEGDHEAIETVVREASHVRGFIRKDIKMEEIETFMASEKQVIEISIGDIIEIIGGAFKGEKGKVTRIDDTKQEITVEFIEAAIPIPVTVPINSVTIYEKKGE